MGEYTGEVTTGGPAQTRQLPDLTIRKISVGLFDNNAYLLRCNSTGEQLLIDAADEPATLLGLLDEHPLQTVVTTHRHADHWQALEEIVRRTGADTVAHPDDAPGLPVPVSHAVRDGDTLTLGSIELEVVHLVGHTPGSVVLVYRDPRGHPHAWTGDCLFPGGIGNTHQDPMAFASLFRGVEEKLFGRLPDETWIYPGHGNDTRLGAERPHLQEWRERGW